MVREGKDGFLKNFYNDVRNSCRDKEEKNVFYACTKVLFDQVIRPHQEIFAYESLNKLGNIYLRIGLAGGRTRTFGRTGHPLFLISLKKNNLYKIKFGTRIFLEYYDFVIERKIENVQMYFKLLHHLYKKNEPQTAKERGEKFNWIGNTINTYIRRHGLLKDTDKCFPYLKIVGAKKTITNPAHLYYLSDELENIFKIFLDEKNLNEWDKFKKKYRSAHIGIWVRSER